MIFSTSPPRTISTWASVCLLNSTYWTRYSIVDCIRMERHPGFSNLVLVPSGPITSFCSSFVTNTFLSSCHSSLIAGKTTPLSPRRINSRPENKPMFLLPGPSVATAAMQYSRWPQDHGWSIRSSLGVHGHTHLSQQILPNPLMRWLSGTQPKQDPCHPHQVPQKAPCIWVHRRTNASDQFITEIILRQCCCQVIFWKKNLLQTWKTPSGSTASFMKIKLCKEYLAAKTVVIVTSW